MTLAEEVSDGKNERNPGGQGGGKSCPADQLASLSTSGVNLRFITGGEQDIAPIGAAVA